MPRVRANEPLARDATSIHESLCTLRFASLVSSCELGKAVKHTSTTAAAPAPAPAPAPAEHSPHRSVGQAEEGRAAAEGDAAGLDAARCWEEPDETVGGASASAGVGLRCGMYIVYLVYM